MGNRSQGREEGLQATADSTFKWKKVQRNPLLAVWPCLTLHVSSLLWFGGHDGDSFPFNPMSLLMVYLFFAVMRHSRPAGCTQAPDAPSKAGVLSVQVRARLALTCGQVLHLPGCSCFPFFLMACSLQLNALQQMLPTYLLESHPGGTGMVAQDLVIKRLTNLAHLGQCGQPLEGALAGLLEACDCPRRISVPFLC